MIDLDRIDRDFAEIDEFIRQSVEALDNGDKTAWTQRAGISRQALWAYEHQKSDFSMKKKLDIYRRLRDK